VPERAGVPASEDPHRSRRRRSSAVAATAAALVLAGGIGLPSTLKAARPLISTISSRVRAPVSTTATASTPGADWTTLGGGLGNPFSSPSPVAPPSSDLWYAPADGEVTSNPVVVGNQVFFGTWAGTVYAVARTTGRVLWTAKVDGTPINAGTLYDGGHLFVATSGGRVAALNPATGAIVWISPPLFPGLSDALRAAPRVYGGVLYESLGGQDDALGEKGGVVALDEASGHVLWETTLVNYSGGGAAVFSPPAVIPQLDELVIGTGNPTPFPGDTAAPGDVPSGPDPYSDSLVALSLTTGNVLWATQAHLADANDYDYIAAPNAFQLPDGRWVVGDGEKDGSYKLLDATDGTILWGTNLTLPSMDTLVVATAAVGGGGIYVGTMDVAAQDAAGNWPGNYQSPGTGRLVALDAETGVVVWSDAVASTIAAAPVAAAGTVLATLANGTVLAVNAATGATQWHTQAPGQIWNAEAALTLAGGVLYVPLANPGGVAAYRLSG